MNYWLIGALALSASVFSACGGGSGSSVSSDLSTDGILGELPKVVDEYQIFSRESKAEESLLYQTGTTDKDKERLKEILTEQKAKEAAYELKRDELVKGLIGKEIPVEASEGLPIKVTKAVISESNRVWPNITYSGEFTEAAKSAPGNWKTESSGDYMYYAYYLDAEGKAFSSQMAYIKLGYGNDADAGTTFEATFPLIVEDYTAAGFSGLSKVVIAQWDGDYAQQANEQIDAVRKAYRDAIKAATAAKAE